MGTLLKLYDLAFQAGKTEDYDSIHHLIGMYPALDAELVREFRRGWAAR